VVSDVEWEANITFDHSEDNKAMPRHPENSELERIGLSD